MDEKVREGRSGRKKRRVGGRESRRRLVGRKNRRRSVGGEKGGLWAERRERLVSERKEVGCGKKVRADIGWKLE